MLSESIQRQIISTMQRDLGGDSAAFKITEIEPATWDDRRIEATNCQLTERKVGYKVQVQGQGETWTYYVAEDGTIQLDALASISLTAHQTLMKSLGHTPNGKLDTLAANLLGRLPSSDASALVTPCDANPAPHWQLLIDIDQSPYPSMRYPRPIAIDLQGELVQQSSLTSFLPQDLAGLDPIFAEAVLHDVHDRHLGVLPPNLTIESIKQTSWTDNRAGQIGVPLHPGPSQKEKGGACCIAPVPIPSGWQVITRSGPIRWVHYLQSYLMEVAQIPDPRLRFAPLVLLDGTQRRLASLVLPDGSQSLPNSIAEAIIQIVAQGEKHPQDYYHIDWVTSRFFDACLNSCYQFDPVDDGLNSIFNAINTALFCRQGLQSGWVVQVRGPGKNGYSRVFSYHTNLTGSEIRFISATNWIAIP
jgi:hypothetical protein